jgi:4Fe-4S ferredoxin
MSQLTAASCKQPPAAMMPVVDLKRCEGRGDCVRVCPEVVFRVRRIDDADYARLSLMLKLKQRVHGMQVAYTPNVDACRGCGLCVAACPEKAITLSRAAHAQPPK